MPAERGTDDREEPAPRGRLGRVSDFQRLWAAQSVSETGTQMGQLAVPLLAMGALHASATELGFLSGARMLPFLVLALPAGALLDRIRRLPVMVLSDVCRALLVVSVPLAYALDLLTFAQLYLVVLLVGVFTVAFDVAYQSYLPTLVGREDLAGANARLTASASAAELAGPAAAGVLTGALGAAATVLVDGVSFLASGLLCRAIRHREPVPERAAGAPGSLRGEVGEGLGFVLRRRELRAVAGSAAFLNLGSSMLTVLLTLYMVRELHYSSTSVGVVLSLGGAGLVAGALAARRVIDRLGYGRSITAGAVLCVAGLVVTPLASPGLSWPFLAGGQLLFGFGVPLFNIAQVTLRQALTPDRLRGRMNASMRFVIWSVIAVGGPVAGLLAQAAGTRGAMVVAAAAGALAWLPLLVSPVPALRELPRVPEPA
ncbi:MFS transporter [Streptomyces sp. NBC_00557]|uniref:MFS transporter n=1 Tax=Streptomyces sp. NBC_00557 TaxID=2975776 RepID=UPI002E818C71|nr:MFS transporter [Streptomyces sp. NBC_00557]WUC40285.1 MFS transporter [Streptomyces sp. NBC_00557]